MCLGIPAQIVETEEGTDLAVADVFGARRQINLGLLEEAVAPGEWVLLHAGFAVTRIGEDEVEQATRSLAMVGSGDAALTAAREAATSNGDAMDAMAGNGIIDQWEKEEALSWE